MILSMETQIICKDQKNLEDILDFRNLDENHELLSKKSKKRFGRRICLLRK